MDALFEFFTALTWAGLIKWVLSHLPGLLALLVGFIGLVATGWRAASRKSAFTWSPRYFRDWLIVIFGGALCTLGLLIVLGVVNAG